MSQNLGVWLLGAVFGIVLISEKIPWRDIDVLHSQALLVELSMNPKTFVVKPEKGSGVQD